jgi:hypothetical protein
MIRFVAAALWICAVTVGSIFFAFSASSERSSPEEKPAFFGGLDYVKTDVISVPLVKTGKVAGYFLARFVYTAEQSKLAALSVPAEAMLVDQLYTYLYTNPQIDFTATEKVDLDVFRIGLRDSINERLGDKLLHDVLIEQIDFLSKEEIRDNTIRRRTGAEKPAALPPAAPAAH